MSFITTYLRLGVRFLRFYCSAGTRYTLHAPFVFELTEKVVEDQRAFYAFALIEQLRQRLLRNNSRMVITDYGAGSQITPGPVRTISSLARHSAVSPAVGQLLFRLVHFLKPRRILELGTSLGISTAYQAAAALRAEFISIEGCPETARRAKQHFQQLGLPHIRLLNGPFRERLPDALQHLQQLDYLYLDGDHRAGASLEYFHLCLPYTHNGSVFVIADIHWSQEMESAWQEMKQHSSVTLSIDLFHLGLLFFRKEQRHKEHYPIIRAKYKPWLIGVLKG